MAMAAATPPIPAPMMHTEHVSFINLGPSTVIKRGLLGASEVYDCIWLGTCGVEGVVNVSAMRGI